MRDSAGDEFYVLYLKSIPLLDSRKNGRIFVSEVKELFDIIPMHSDEFRMESAATEILQNYVSFEMFRSGLFY